MEHGGDAEEPPEKNLSSQVLEYYKRYSQNRELPKYFSGAQKFNMDFLKRHKEIIQEDIHKPSTSTLVEVATATSPVNVAMNDNLPIVSPTSSVASNRRLEWDNGADIGYSNVDATKILQKSISLPVLNTVEYEKLCESLKGVKPTQKEGFICDKSPSRTFKPLYSSSGTEESAKSFKKYFTSSSSSAPPAEHFSSSSNSTSNEGTYSNRLGFPLAESTPFIPVQESGRKLTRSKNNGFKITGGFGEESSNPRKGVLSGNVEEKLSSSCENLNSPKLGEFKKWHSQVDLHMVDQVAFYKNLKTLKLCISKPILVECVGKKDSRMGEHKLIQTSLPRNTSIAVQTDFDFTNAKFKLGSGEKQTFERQSVLYICHSDSDLEPTTRSSSTQTNNSNPLLSNCNSFEYLSGGDYANNKIEFIAEIPVIPASTEFGANSKNPNLNLAMSDYSNSNKTSSSVSSSPLAQLIASQHAGCLTPDIEENIKLLRNVIKSKKYNEVTKKRCVKKLVEKMVDTKYTDDTSENSEPTKSTQGAQENNAIKLQNLTTQIFTNEMPVNSDDTTVFNPISSDFVPVEIVNDKNDRLQRNSFTLTDTKGVFTPKIPNLDDNRNATGDVSSSTETELQGQTSTTTPIISTNSSGSQKNTSDENKSWREDKTRSEQLLEQTLTNKDHLLNFAQKERKHQLSWISNEISHLSKLKKLLENKHAPVAAERNIPRILQKPHVEDMKGLKKSTSVYIVTTEKNVPRGSCNPNCTGVCKSVPNANGGLKSVRIQEEVSVPKQGNIYETTANVTTPPRHNALSQSTNLILRPPSLIGHGAKVFDIGNEEIDLKNARLVSSEQFTSGTNNGPKRQTSIRRYTFEIPVDYGTIDTEVAGCPGPINTRPTSPKQCQMNNIESAPVNLGPSNSRCTSPKFCKRFTGQLVTTSEIRAQTNTTRSNSPIKQPCTCVNASSQAISCKCNLEHKKVQTSKSLMGLELEDSGSSSSTNSSTSYFNGSTAGTSTETQLCRCCKQAAIKRPSKPERNVDHPNKYILCYPCFNQNRTHAYYTNPGHVCACYSTKQAGIVEEMRETIKELDALEREEYCKCVKAEKSKSGYCSRCKCKLQNNFNLKKGGLAYTLTLESGSERKRHKKKSSSPVLEEIKIKIASPKKHKKARSSSACSRSSEDSSKENSSRKKRRHKRKSASLQDYLCANKPNFVVSAEKRRQCLLDLAFMREERCNKYKQLLALTNGIPSQNHQGNIHNLKNQQTNKHMFSSEEMKEITAKTYKKLPEVQQKLIDNKEKQIKKANKLLADIFNQKLRQRALKGVHTIPTNASIINLAQ